MTIQAMKVASPVLFAALALSLSPRFAVSQVPLMQRKAALHQWYRQDFSVENAPAGLGFDGSNIWVTNSNGASVTKMRAIDGVKLGSFPVGPGPDRVLFDGENIWVANFGSNTVTKLRASTGANLGTFRVGNSPLGMAFDGADGTINKLAASDGRNLETLPGSWGLEGIAFDGANIWTTNVNSNVVSKH